MVRTRGRNGGIGTGVSHNGRYNGSLRVEMGGRARVNGAVFFRHKTPAAGNPDGRRDVLEPEVQSGPSSGFTTKKPV